MIKKKEKIKEQELLKIKKKGIDTREMTIIAIAIGVIIALINFLFFSQNTQVFTVLNMVAVVVALAIPLYTHYIDYNRTKQMEEVFPQFLRDMTDNINAGMSVPQAIRATTDNDYGVLSQCVKELSMKIDWGITFDKAFMDFAAKTKSKIIKRTVRGIIEVHGHGGSINTVLESISSSVLELENIKKERATSIYGPMVTGYFIFFLFLGIMLTLAKVLIPAFVWQNTSGIGDIQSFFAGMFRNMALIQGIFAGIGIGKMAEGTLSAGIKHAFVLGIIGYTTFAIF